MTFLHFRFQRRLGLLAASALDAREAAWVRGHVDTCPSCRADLEALKQTEALLRADAAVERALPISSEALKTRVLAQIRTAPRRTVATPAWTFATGITAVGLVAAGVLAGVLTTRLGPAPTEVAVVTSIEDRADTARNNAAFYERLEKTQVRADAVRYLAEAQDVLVQMRDAAECPDSPKDSVDVAQEARTSRTLLTRRAALVSGSGETLVAAQGVMEEVEGLLQQVAELPQCTRRADVAKIARNVQHRNLLMKIDMVAQELAAP